jgi:hypothetical protein
MLKAWLALLLLLISVPATPAGPPGGPSGRLVVDEAPALRAEIMRQARENPGQPADATTRARLAEAEGRRDEAAAVWNALIASTQAQYQQLVRLVKAGRDCSLAEFVVAQGLVAEARCRLAELEQKPAVLVEELPQAIASYYAHLEMFDKLRSARAVDESEAREAERRIWKDLRRARLRLDAARRKLGQ